MIAGTLEIQLMANMARIAGDMRKAQNTVGSAMRNIEGAVASAKSALGALGVGIGFGALVAGFKSVVDAAAQLDDLSEKTGAAVEELSKLEQVARIGGHSMETAESALIRLSKAIHGTDEESQGAGKALAALGLSAEALRNMDTAQALRTVATELNKYADGSGKTALAVDLLGKAGAQALPFLKDLANEGGINARVTAEQAAAAEEFQKSLGRLKNELQGVGQALALEAVPGMNDWIAANREAIRIAGSFSEALRLFVFNLDAMTTEKPREQIDRLTAALLRYQQASAIGKFMQSPTGFLFGGREEDLKKQIEFLKFLERQQNAIAFAREEADARAGDQPAKILNYASAAAAAGKSAQQTAGRFEDYAMRTQAAVAAAINSSDVVKAEEFVRQMEFLDKLFFEHGLDPKIYESAMKKLTGATDNAADAARRQQAIMAEGQRIYDATWTPLEAFNIELLNLKRLLDENAISWDVYVRALGQAQERFASLSKTGKAELDEMTEFTKQAARNMQDSMKGLFFDLMQGNVTKMGERFKRAMDDMVADMLAAQANAALFGKGFGKTTDQVGGLVGDALKLFSGGKGVEGPTQDGGNISGGGFGGLIGAFGKIFGFAAGGDFLGGRPILVGEQGPELMVPRASGTVIPNHELGGQNVTNNNIKVTINVPASVDRSTVDQIGRTAGARVARALNRNG